MKAFKILLIVIVLIILAMAACNAAPLTVAEQNRIADAIYKIEGGDKAKVAYGVLSVKVKDKAHARRICLASIRNNWQRYLDQSKETNFFYLMADRWCPKSADPVGNRNWRNNIVKQLGSIFVNDVNSRKTLSQR